MSQVANLYPRGVELVSGAIIENKEGLILLTQSPRWSNKWVLPGGHIEPGEAIMDAIVREGQEETGLILKGIKVFHWGELIGSRDFHRPAHFVYFDAHCVVTGGTLNLDKSELSNYKWILLNEALKLNLADSYKETLEAFIKYKNE